MLHVAPARPCLRIVVFSAMLSVAATGVRADNGLAKQILDETGVAGGLIVHIGCGDGKLTAALRADEHLLVHGLDRSADNIREARARLCDLGLYGPVSVDEFDGKHLPYAENMVNLVVAEDLDGVAIDEAMRVLAPGGMLYAKQDGQWQKRVKPRPVDIDEWTHFLHDASGNAVAHDEVVGPPGRLQWSAGPRYMRSHEHIPGIYALVSTGGRIFYIVDEAPTASIRYTPQWNLVARDAFNGLLLWKKPVGEWFPHIVNWGQTPRQLERKLVAIGDRVYVSLGIHAPLSIVDATTGETIKVLDETRGTEEIIVHDGVLLLVVQAVTEERITELERWAELLGTPDSPAFEREAAEPLVKRLRSTENSGSKAILAFDAASGRLLWRKDGPDVSGLRLQTLSALGGRVFYQNGGNVVSLDLKTGQDAWSTPTGPIRLVHGDRVFCAGGKMLIALSAATGQTLWKQAPLLTEIRDLFVAGGSLWIGGFKPIEGKRGPSWGPYFATERDPATGEVLQHIEPENPGHHHRCYQNKATDRYILGGRRGTEFIDLDSGEVLWNSWARGVCRYGIMPCNGLLYTPPHACGCYMAAKLTGFNALAPREESGPDATTGHEPPRLQQGPAFDAPPSAATTSSADWPTYRGDAQRSGCTSSAISAQLQRRWQQSVGDRLTAATVRDGKVFVASVDDHRVLALDADSGRSVWQFTAGGRVDSPPTLHQGRALFGCRDGAVYSVSTADGSLAWRLQADCPGRRVVANGQLESVLPVHGSVLIRDNMAWFTAGRSSYLDGGIDLWHVDPETGNTLSKTSIYSPDPQTGRQPPHTAPAFMPGARWDILVADGDFVYLRDLVFDNEGKRQPEGNPHLFTMTDFLDGAWAHRSYWIFGKELSCATGCSGRDRQLIYGRLLVFDDSTIYGYGRPNVHWSNQLLDAPYRLIAVNRGDGTARWSKSVPVHVRAMLLAGDVLFVAGCPASANEPLAAPIEGDKGLLVALSASDGRVLAEYPLDAPPVLDGLAGGAGRLYVPLVSGEVVCMGK